MLALSAFRKAIDALALMEQYGLGRVKQPQAFWVRHPSNSVGLVAIKNAADIVSRPLFETFKTQETKTQ
ncbi:hypothetical protein [Rhizobium sp. 18065]|uniref:hypothetical protein n=1 Tax=Rhizobium sp. 18065 TaxID=2681411 RepID=UPI001357766A|nr:hypothetical protein [Rhizobium sp. 18065]